MIIDNILNTIKEYFQEIDIVRSCYLSGSYANEYNIDGVSDIDVLILCENSLDLSFAQATFRKNYPNIDFDLNQLLVSDLFDNDNNLVREFALSSKLCGFCFYGEDLLKNMELPSLDEYKLNTIQQTIHMIENARYGEVNISSLMYPNVNDEFYGYLLVRNGVISTKQIISIYTWIGTSYLALQGVYCGCKNDCINQCNKLLNNDFSNLLNDVYENCRGKWGYVLPHNDEDIEKIKYYCKELLNQERNFAKFVQGMV